MPKKVQAALLGNSRALEIVCKEKMMLMYCLKLSADKAEEWLLDILAREHHDLRDIRQVLLLIMKQSGTIQRIDGDCVGIQLYSFHNPRYQRAADSISSA